MNIVAENKRSVLNMTSVKQVMKSLGADITDTKSYFCGADNRDNTPTREMIAKRFESFKGKISGGAAKAATVVRNLNSNNRS